MTMAARVLKVIAVLAGVLLVWFLLGVFSARHSVLYLATLAVVVLPLSCWYRKQFAWTTLVFLALAIALAAWA